MFLQNVYFFCQSWLVIYCGRYMVQQCGYFCIGQGVMIDVIDEQQYIMIFVMEFFCYGQVGQCNVQMVFWWFVYLVIYQGYFIDNVGVGYFVVEVVIFMSMFFYVCKY